MWTREAKTDTQQLKICSNTLEVLTNNRIHEDYILWQLKKKKKGKGGREGGSEGERKEGRKIFNNQRISQSIYLDFI